MTEIDVSNCYAERKMMKDGLYCFWEGGSCEDQDCYYKQLQQLKQEKYTTELCPNCETEVQLPNAKGIFECLNCHKLIVACSNCKEQNCSTCKLANFKDIYGENFTLTEKCYKLQKEKEELKEKINKFKWDNPYFDLYNNANERANSAEQKLEKIEEIAKENCSCPRCEEEKYCDSNCEDYNYKRILQIIEEQE